MAPIYVMGTFLLLEEPRGKPPTLILLVPISLVPVDTDSTVTKLNLLIMPSKICVNIILGL